LTGGIAFLTNVDQQNLSAADFFHAKPHQRILFQYRRLEFLEQVSVLISMIKMQQTFLCIHTRWEQISKNFSAR
jgi:hypothetical protein